MINRKLKSEKVCNLEEKHTVVLLKLKTMLGFLSSLLKSPSLVAKVKVFPPTPLLNYDLNETL